jgi:hypothetical protein
MKEGRTSKAENVFLRRTGKAVEKTKRHFIMLLTQEICEIKETVEGKGTNNKIKCCRGVRLAKICEWDFHQLSLDFLVSPQFSLFFVFPFTRAFKFRLGVNLSQSANGNLIFMA